MNIINLETTLFFMETPISIQLQHMWVISRGGLLWNGEKNLVGIQYKHPRWTISSQSVKEQKTEKCLAFDDYLNFCIHLLSFQNKTSSHTLHSVCLGICLSVSESQCWAGQGHRGFSDGVGGLCFATLSSKSCLSVQSSWTSCNNINGPLNRLLCCAALAWVTSHTCTLAHSVMHKYDRACVDTTCSQIYTEIPFSHTPDHRCMFNLASTSMHRFTQQYTVDLLHISLISALLGLIILNSAATLPDSVFVCLLCLFVCLCEQTVALLVFAYGSSFVTVNH